MTDTELIDALEKFITDEPLVMWYGLGDFPGGRLCGLALLQGRRTLREALEELLQ